MKLAGAPLTTRAAFKKKEELKGSVQRKKREFETERGNRNPKCEKEETRNEKNRKRKGRRELTGLFLEN